jgi:hypothetical protein
MGHQLEVDEEQVKLLERTLSDSKNELHHSLKVL